MDKIGSAILLKDFESIDSSLLRKFDGSVVAVTGATGLLGSLVCKLLLWANECYGISIHVVAVARNKGKFESQFIDFRDSKFLSFICHEFGCRKELTLPKSTAYIVHCASVTASDVMIKQPVETMYSSIEGTQEVLKSAMLLNARVVYLSSMEAYGVVNSSKLTSEYELGSIDLSNVRSCYPEGKRACELLCLSYCQEYSVAVVVARLAQTFGAGVFPSDNRAFAQFAKAAMRGEDIVLRTKGTSAGNYVYSSDAIEAILLLLIKGEIGHTYNVSNMASHMTIIELAKCAIIASESEKSKILFDLIEGQSPYAAETHLYMDSSKMKQLGWNPCVDIEESFRRLIEYYKELGLPFARQM